MTKYLLVSLAAFPLAAFVIATAGVTVAEFVKAMIGASLAWIAGGVVVLVHQRAKSAGPRDPSRPL